MRVLVIGAGAVGGAILLGAVESEVFTAIIAADVNPARVEAAAARCTDDRVEACTIDASDASGVTELARAKRVDIVVNACDPRFNPPIFDGAFAAGCHYLDMAMSLSQRHPERPFELVGV